jgi:hypothetical protein
MEETYGDKKKAKEVFYASKNAGRIEGVDGWTRGCPLSDVAVMDKVHRTGDGYLACEARVARVGTQRYKGREVGMHDKDFVVLYRPESEVFSRAAMHSMAFKPVTLTHPGKMVDSKSWGRVAKGYSTGDVVRDGEYVRVPLMLADAAAIDAYESGVRELSVGYTTDIDWTPGTTPTGERYDGVQRDIRANHHALVPVARGGANLRFGDADGIRSCPNCGVTVNEDALACPNCGYDLKPTARSGGGDDDSTDPVRHNTQGGGPHATDAYPEAEFYDREVGEEERKSLAKEGKALKGGGYPIKNKSDLGNAIQAFGRAKNPAATKALIIRRARELGATSMLPENWGVDDSEGANDMDTVRMMLSDGSTVEVVGGESAERLKNFLRDQESNFGGKKAPPFKKKNGNGDDKDDDDTDARDDAVAAEQAREKKERGYKDSIAAKDGQIAMLRRQLEDATLTDERQEEIIRERERVKDAAKKLLGDGYDYTKKNLNDIRRDAVGFAMGDPKAVRDWDDAKIGGAFEMATSSIKAGGARKMADGMSNVMRFTGEHRLGDTQVSDADAAYEERNEKLRNAWKNPISVGRT